MLRLAMQSYCPPWEVRTGVKLRVLVDTSPATSVSMATGLPVVMEPSGVSHCRRGDMTRYSTTMAVQVSVRGPPAVVSVGGARVTLGGGRSAGEHVTHSPY